MKLELKKLLHEVARELAPKEGPDLSLELIPPKSEAHGDLSSDLAFKLAKALKKPPQECADKIVKLLEKKIDTSDQYNWIREVQCVKPGFLNFYLNNTFFSAVLRKINEEDVRYGESKSGGGQKILLEYVSANPTGPLTIAHGRQACVGDAIARILKVAGYEPSREYYMNDAGRQINLLGQSLHARYSSLIGEEGYLFPEDGYQGEYLIELAREIHETYGKKLEGKRDEKTEAFFRSYAKDNIFKNIQDDLHKADIHFDNIFSEQTLYERGFIDECLKILEKNQMLYEKDGALWLKTEKCGDDKDRVLRKKDGSYTYLTPDIAYHRFKFGRGFERLVNLWGPDHHGYIARLKAAIEEVGYKKEDLVILIVQLTTLFRNGEPVRMSTRKGEFITFRELLDEVGRDAARFFFLMRRIESHLDFDLELAKKKSDDNPVFYLQYAHTRICSILRKAEKTVNSSSDLSLLNTPEELGLIRLLGEYPDILAGSAQSFEPYPVVDYLRNLAQAFHRFYSFHRVISDDETLSQARLFLANCCRIVLRNGLGVLGISSPEKM